MVFGLFSSDPSLQVSPEKVKERLDNGEKLLFLDVREQWEFDLNHLEGAVHIPLKELPSRFEELDPDAEIIAYCHKGIRSLKAIRFLKEKEFKNSKNLDGGIDAWSLRIDSSIPRYR